MKKLLIILPLALILCFMVGCQDKEAMAELEEFRAQAAVEEQNKEITDAEKIEIAEIVKKLALECAEVFGRLEQEPYMKYYLYSNSFTFVMNGQTTRSYSSFYDKVKSSMNNLQEADVEYTDLYVDVYSREFATAHGPFKWSAIYQDGKHEEVMGHISFVYILDKGEWKIAFASEYFPSEIQMP